MDANSVQTEMPSIICEYIPTNSSLYTHKLQYWALEPNHENELFFLTMFLIISIATLANHSKTMK